MSSFIADHTTLRLGGPAARLIEATDVDTIVDTVRGSGSDPLLLIAGGSNLVVADQGFAGTVLRLAHRGIAVERGEHSVLLTVQAGTDFDELVAFCVAEGFSGIECLSGIPGSVGATPVQNVGAYGCEISQTLVSVDLLNRASGEVSTVAAADLGLGYRTSILKNSEQAIVLCVRLQLGVDGLSVPIRYGELARTLGVEQGARVAVAAARDAVLELRTGKGMVLDAADHDTWSAGSFFTNPIVEAARAVPDAPHYPAAPGSVKLSAGWLIEHAGFSKGHAGPGGRVSLSTKHTLALTNRGGASTDDLLVLAREVRDGVYARFGVELHHEPVFVNCTL